MITWIDDRNGHVGKLIEVAIIDRRFDGMLDVIIETINGRDRALHTTLDEARAAAQRMVDVLIADAKLP